MKVIFQTFQLLMGAMEPEKRNIHRAQNEQMKLLLHFRFEIFYCHSFKNSTLLPASYLGGDKTD